MPLFELEEKARGAAIFEEGWAGDKFYILLHGQLRVFKGHIELATLEAHPSGSADQIWQCGSDEARSSYPFFGEMSLMDATPRMASVLAPCP